MSTTLIDAGSNPTLPVATKTIGGGIFQLTSPMRRGSADYDSGIVPITAVSPAAPALVTSATIYPEGGYVANTTDEPILATLTDTSGAVFFRKRIDGGDTVPIPLAPGCSLAGWKAGADVAGLNVCMWGAQ